MDKVFVDAYLKQLKKNEKIAELKARIIKEEIDEDGGIDWDGNSFDAFLRRDEGRRNGTYEGQLWGEVITDEAGKVYVDWSVSDYNTAFDGSLGLEIDGETAGKIEVTTSPEDTVNELFEKFKEAFEELDVNEYADEDYDDDYDLGERYY